MAPRTLPVPSRSGTRPFDAARLVAALRPHVRIAHQISGRVRLRLAAAAFETAAWRAGGGDGLRACFAALPGVRAIGFNALARSCVVEYDPALIPDAAWADLLAGRASPAASTLAGLLTSASFSSTSQEISP